MDVPADWGIGYFGDLRLAKVGAKLFERVVEKGSLIIKFLSSRRSEQVRFERFLWNQNVRIEEMLKVSQKQVSEIIVNQGAKHVALIQDTTQCNYKFRKNEVRGLGVIQNDDGPGVFIHPVLAMDVRDGFPLGLTACKFWSRDPGREKNSRQTASKKTPQEKESYKWTEAIRDSQEAVRSADRVTVVADREADLYPMMVDLSSEKIDVLVRSNGTRLARHPGKLRAEKLIHLVTELPVASTREIEIPKKSVINHKLKMSVRQHRKEAENGRKARSATLALRFQKFEILRPGTSGVKDYPESKEIYCIQVDEINPPDGIEPLSWTLLSTRAISSAEEAWEMVDLYKKRWLIEVMFKTSKKGGYDIEQIEAVKADVIMKLCFLGLVASVKVLQLTFCREGEKNRPINTVFSEQEVKVLNLLNQKHEGKTVKQKNPHTPGTLAWAHWVLARSGGWMGYTKSEGPAGATIVKRGLDRLQQTVEALELIENVCTS